MSLFQRIRKFEIESTSVTFLSWKGKGMRRWRDWRKVKYLLIQKFNFCVDLSAQFIGQILNLKDGTGNVLGQRHWEVSVQLSYNLQCILGTDSLEHCNDVATTIVQFWKTIPLLAPDSPPLLDLPPYLSEISHSLCKLSPLSGVQSHCRRSCFFICASSIMTPR